MTLCLAQENGWIIELLVYDYNKHIKQVIINKYQSWEPEKNTDEDTIEEVLTNANDDT